MPEIAVSEVENQYKEEIERLRNRIKQLEGVCDVANKALSCIEEWQGMASTKQAARDSLWRLGRALKQAGWEYAWQDNLDWRGSTFKELNDAGFYPSTDDPYHATKPEFVYDPEAPIAHPARVFGNAVGPTIKEIVTEWLAMKSTK